MRIYKLALCAWLAAGAGALAQQPDCSFNFVLTAAGNSAAFPNTCAYLWMAYKSTGFSGLSVQLNGAPDSSGAPGAFVALPGTVNVGSNPLTSTTGAYAQITATQTNLAAWLQVNLSGLTGAGQVTGVIYGYKNATTGGGSGGGSSGCAGTAGTPCIVAGPTAPGSAPTKNPVEISLIDGAGNVINAQDCSLSVFFDTSSSGNTLLVAASGSTQVRLCHFAYQDIGTGNTVQLKQGTGATCAGSTANFGMKYVSVAAVAQDYQLSPLVSSASNAICINLSNATEVSGEITYAQY